MRKTSGGAKKLGRNKEKCQRYRDQNRREKNKIRKWKKLIKKLDDNGIITIGTFIIGFEHHNHKNVWDEIHALADLELTEYLISNLKLLPTTPLWNKYKKEGKLLQIPIDFYYINGFQSFIHPHFKPGFEDMLPLLRDIYEFLEKENGNNLLNTIKLYNNKQKSHKYFKRQVKLYKNISKIQFSSWKKNLNPTPTQIEKYQKKMEIELK